MNKKNAVKPRARTNLLARLALLLALGIVASGCGYNTLQEQDEAIKANWGHVLNQYQRRYDLVPTLVRVVQAYASHERGVFEEVARARAAVGEIRLDAGAYSSRETLAHYTKVQERLGNAIYNVLVLAENYPQLKSDGVFRDLQVQLEGTENRIAYARQRYIAAVYNYNVTVRSFPSNLTARVLGYETNAGFSVASEAEISAAPRVNLQ
jgi:LemA protein